MASTTGGIPAQQGGASVTGGQEQGEQRVVSSPQPPTDENDLKKCWICFSDESEDGPESSPWRDPCPCALVAHEDCLLDWIADMESPTSRKRTLGPPKIACPQCKSDIHLVRPRNALVEAVKALERLAAKAVTPAALATGFWTVVHACTAHGIYSIYQIFGSHDAHRILRPLLYHVMFPHQESPSDVVNRLLTHWRLRVGLPLITPLLVLSRTTLADSVLPVLPIVFFATQGDSAQPLHLGAWPPSASMTIAVLPYMRSAYNAYYDRVWAEREKKWLKDIQPRSGRSDADQPDDPQQMPDGDNLEGDNNFEIRIDGNIWEDWADPVAPEGAPALNAPPLPDNEPQLRPPQNPPAQQQQQPQPQPQPPAGQQERLLSFSTTAIAESVLGALMFPTIASLSGDALKYMLPKSWTTSALGLGKGKSTGLLQEKWGRSIVGGCLFVVVKDAVMLYVRWKMAQQHHRRHVLDWDRKAKKYK